MSLHSTRAMGRTAREEALPGPVTHGMGRRTQIAGTDERTHTAGSDERTHIAAGEGSWQEG